MDPIEFACVINEITKCLNIHIDTDITAQIFDIYKGSYDNYTFLELLSLLRDSDYDITVPWNKKALIKMIEENNLDIPKKQGDMEITNWWWKNFRYSNIDVIYTKYMNFDDSSYCVFQDSQGNVQIVERICSEEVNGDNIIVVYFQDMKTKKEFKVHANDFIWNLENTDITILELPQYQKYLTADEIIKFEDFDARVTWRPKDIYYDSD
jgi:hypothetical protein